MNEIFHVHSYRCGHADNVSDEEYILKALQTGATSITFTDHAPFPEDPFSNRMKYNELDEYISTLVHLKNKYSAQISVFIGLEIEYLPSFEDYYKELRYKYNLDLLLLGQHHYEHSSGIYNFQIPKEMLTEKEYEGIMKAQIAGIKSKHFEVIAHPDRAFRRERVWNENMTILSKELIDVAIQNHVVLEKNLQSQKRKYNYWQEFWNLVPPNAKCIIGQDAHSIEQLLSKDRNISIARNMKFRY